MKLRKFTILLVLLSLAMLFISGCDDRDFPTSTDAKYQIVRIDASVNKIYADNNVTFSYIRAYVKDDNNFGAPGIVVYFQTDYGKVIAQVTTDESGVAKTPFWDDGDLPEIATIQAYVYTYSAFDETLVTGTNSREIQVEIAEKPGVGGLDIEISAHQFFVNQTVLVRAEVVDVNDAAVADSTIVRFETTRGYFLDADGETSIGSIAMVPTQNGNAQILLSVGQQAGDGIVTAKIDTFSTTDTFLVTHGNPSRLELVSYLADEDMNQIGDYTSIASVDEENNIVIEALLKDAYNNPCGSKVVRYETNLGTFSNTSESYFQNTDATGTCKANFTPGLSAGQATITAFANGDTLSTQILFHITSDDLYSIRFSQEDQVNLNVANTGGQDSAILLVDLYDINGNLIDNPTSVFFKIINATIPGEAEGNPAFLSGQDDDGIVEITSSGGHASVSVVAGSGSGVIAIRVANQIEAIDDVTIEGAIVASKGNVVIQSGPPETVTFGIGGFDDGEQVGAGMWEVLVTAQIKDINNNPVDWGTSVIFSVDSPDCMIQGSAYVGNGPIIADDSASNINIDSLSSVGIAYTILNYPAEMTYDEITVSIRTVGGDGVEVYEEGTLELPYNEPETDAQTTPGNLSWYDGDAGAALDDPMYATLTLKTRDGYGVDINGATWTCSVDRGVFYHPMGLVAPAPNKCVSGELYYYANPLDPATGTGTSIDMPDGYGQVFVKLTRGDCLPSPDGVSPGQQQIAAEARLLGTGISERMNLILLRFPFASPN